MTFNIFAYKTRLRVIPVVMVTSNGNMSINPPNFTFAPSKEFDFHRLLLQSRLIIDVISVMVKIHEQFDNNVSNWFLFLFHSMGCSNYRTGAIITYA